MTKLLLFALCACFRSLTILVKTISRQISCRQTFGVRLSCSTGAMRGLMQDHPLLVTDILDFAAEFHGEQEVCEIFFVAKVSIIECP